MAVFLLESHGHCVLTTGPAPRARPQTVASIPLAVQSYVCPAVFSLIYLSDSVFRCCSRAMASTSSQQPPAERAAGIINKMPSSPGLITKTGTILLGTGALATAISQELYVVNEESVLAAGSFILFAYIAKVRISPADPLPFPTFSYSENCPIVSP